MSDFKYYETCNASLLLQFEPTSKRLIVTKFDRDSSNKVRVMQKVVETAPHLTDMRVQFSTLEGDCTQFDFVLFEKKYELGFSRFLFYECWMMTIDCVLRFNKSATDMNLDTTLHSVFYGQNQLVVFSGNDMISYTLRPDPKPLEVFKLVGFNKTQLVKIVSFKGDYYIAEKNGIFLLDFGERIIKKGQNILYLNDTNGDKKNLIDVTPSKHQLVLTLNVSNGNKTWHKRYFMDLSTQKHDYNVSRPNTLNVVRSAKLELAFCEDQRWEPADQTPHKMMVVEYGDDVVFMSPSNTPAVSRSTDGFLSERFLLNLRRVSNTTASPLTNKFGDNFNATFQLVVPIGPNKNRDLYHLLASDQHAELKKLTFTSPLLDCSQADDEWLSKNTITVTILYRAVYSAGETINPVVFSIDFVHQTNHLRQYAFMLTIVMVVIFVMFHIKYCIEKNFEAKNPKEYFPECNKFILEASMAQLDNDD